MDLNNINLPASVIADLYHESLVETGEITAKVQPQQPIAKTTKSSTTVDENPIATNAPAEADTIPTWKWLGENNKNILVMVSYDNVVHLPDQQLQFLTNILGACKLSLADVAIVNLPNQPHQQYKEIIAQFKSRVALLFDIEPASFGLPMSFPHYQIQPFASCSFLYAPSLKELEDDKVQKSKLWVCLKRLFNV